LAVDAGLANELLGQISVLSISKAKLDSSKREVLHRLVLDIQTTHDRKCALQRSRDRRKQEI